MTFIQSIFHQSPEIALFLSLACGYWIGKFHFGSFQLGGVAGSLLAAVAISQVGVHIDTGIKSVLFALFIYAVGYESGPQFFRSLGRQSLREIAMAVVLAISGLLTVILLARLFGLDKGLAAGVAAGGLTQSAIIGTSGAAIAQLDIAAEEVQRLQANVAIGYAVTYIFGSFGAIIVCVNVLEWIMGRSIRDDAIKAEAEMLSRAGASGEQSALPALVGRLFVIDKAAGKTVEEIERLSTASTISVERVKRNGQFIGNNADLILQPNDIVLIVGRRAAVVAVAPNIGSEIQSSTGMDVIVVTRDVIISNADFAGRTVAEIRDHTAKELKHGVFVIEVKRNGQKLTLADDTAINSGDLVTLYGTADDVQRVAQRVGPMIIPSDKTDFVYHGMGLVFGLLIGLLVAHIGSIPLTLGSGGGALLSGLLFGWYRTRHMALGNMPTAASTLLRDLGLAGFVAVVGLQTGQQALTTIAEHGVSLFMIGVAVTIVPLLITMVFGRYVLRYDNAAILAGALSGSRSANPAFGEILDKAGNSVPTVPFAVTYALANVFLTLLGPLVVAFA